MPLQWVIDANGMSASLLRPDLNIYLDISPDIAMQRLTSGRASKELFETMENLTMVREKYFEAFDLLRSSEKIFITDGNRSPENIAADIWAEITRLP